jgi:NinB protein
MSRNAITLQSASDREKAAAWVKNAPTGTSVEFRAPRRSCDQNALLWSLLGQIAQQLTWHGQKLTAEDYKDLCSASLRRYHIVPGIDAGSFVPLGMRTSQMSKQELTDLLELIIAFGTERGVKFREFAEEMA